MVLLNGNPCRFGEVLEGYDFAGLFTRNPTPAMYIL